MKTKSQISPAIVLILVLGALFLMTTGVEARPARQLPLLDEPERHVDKIGIQDSMESQPQKALTDTVWIADWDFDTAGACSDAGWEHADLRMQNDGEIYWNVRADFDGLGGIQGNAAALGMEGSTCCESPDGYGNDWYQALRVPYSGSGFLSFDYLLDSEEGYDFLEVELDSACASFGRSDYLVDPRTDPADFRRLILDANGLDLQGSVSGLEISDFGTNETHCLYIGFYSDAGWSPCDGLWPTSLGKALVVDNLRLSGVNDPVNEDFEGPMDSRLSFVNLHNDQPFGDWSRTFLHVTDNDVCTENTTCAWLFSDDTTPTIGNDASMLFGPGGYVVRNWLDNAIISPWVSLASTAHARRTLLGFRLFGGNLYGESRIAMSVNIRGKGAVGQSPECQSEWGDWAWGSVGNFSWQDRLYDKTSQFDPTSSHVQVRFRISDLQMVWGAQPPSPWIPGPGPYLDRVRIGRVTLSGPVVQLPGPGIGQSILSSKLAQDAFPTEIDPTLPSGSGEHFRPTTDRFGTAAFSMSHDHWWLTGNDTPKLVTGDSIVVVVEDLRDGNGITGVELRGAIVAGPHAGKAPPPWNVDPHGFFSVPGDSSRAWWSGNVVENQWFVDLDDDYFRGGDQLLYFWLAQDALGGVSSYPEGLSGTPVSVAEAEALTEGLFEVSFLPTIDWDPAFLARIAADPHGKLEPTPAELAASTQANCVLYVNAGVNLRRRSGDLNRTSFMYTLDRLGYSGHYDVYDHMGLGTARNELGGRATHAQAAGYSLIIHDSGLWSGGLPFGAEVKIDQSSWYRSWLANAVGSEHGSATLWIVGADVAEAHALDPLVFGDMGVVLAKPDVAIDLNPDVIGQGTFTFENGRTATFSSDLFSLQGGCPTIHQFDAIEASGSALVTHRYHKRQTAEGAMVMNRNPAEHWNTILTSFPWFDIVDPTGSPASPPPEERLLMTVLNGVLPLECLHSADPVTDTSGGRELEDLPERTALHPNVPNPFNPLTEIRFDLAHAGLVQLRIYDVAGRLVRTLVDGQRQAGRHREVWNGHDDGGRQVATGVYFYRMQSSGFEQTRKLVVMR